MIKKIKEYFNKREIEDSLERQRKANVDGPNILSRHENLKKYIPILRQIGDKHYKLNYENLDKTDIEHRFARLIAQRQNELYQSSLLLVGTNYTIAAIPLMRALCDTLYLLKYVEKNPQYIVKFMRKQGDGIRTWQIEDEIADQELKNYYAFLSTLMHSNPDSIKMTYYQSINKKQTKITLIPKNSDMLNDSHIYSLIGILSESSYILDKIYSKNWKA